MRTDATWYSEPRSTTAHFVSMHILPLLTAPMGLFLLRPMCVSDIRESYDV